MKVTTGIFCCPGMMFYLVLKIAAGYVAVRLWKTQLWQSCCLGSSIMVCCLPAIAFLTLPTQIPSVGVAIARAVPFSLFIILLLLWFHISVPLNLGGYFGTRAPTQLELIRFLVKFLPKRTHRDCWFLVQVLFHLAACSLSSSL